MSVQNNALKIVDSVNQLDLAKQHIINSKTDESFFIFDCGKIVRRFQFWKELFPRVTPFYATKCNNHKDVLITLANLGSGFDCASLGEIDLVSYFWNIFKIIIHDLLK